METKEKLTKQLNELNSKIKNKEKELQKSKDNYESTEEWKNLQLRKKEIDNELDVLRKEENKIDSKIRLNFIGGEGSYFPYYTRESYPSKTSTNILNEVLRAIKKHINISLLKASQIEDLVRNLINEEKNSNKRLQELRSKSRKLRDEEDGIRERERELEEGDYSISNELCNLREKRRGIIFAIENPVKQKQYSKRDTERAKVENLEIINKIFKEIKGE